MSSPVDFSGLDDLSGVIDGDLDSDLDGSVDLDALDAAINEQQCADDVDKSEVLTTDDFEWLLHEMEGPTLPAVAVAAPAAALSAAPAAAPAAAPIAAPVASHIVPDFLRETLSVAPPSVRRSPATKRKLNDSQQGCNCKGNTRCLKKYCICYSAGRKCDPSVCGCRNCENDSDRTVAPRVLKGCTCRQSKCLKKYCECFAAGVECDPAKCSCRDCKNRSEGSLVMQL